MKKKVGVKSHIILLWVSLAVCACLTLFSTEGYSQLPLITDNSGTLGRGKSQLELSNGMGYENEHRCVENSTEIAPVFTLGIFEKFDLVLSCPFEFYSEEMDSTVNRISGFSDLGLEIKYCFYSRKVLSLAVKPGISFPTGNYQKGLGGGKVGGSLFLISSIDITPVLLNANIGYIRNENFCGDVTDIWHVSIDADYEVATNTHIVINTGLERNPDPENIIPPVFGMVGFYYLLSENCEISCGYKCGLTKPENDHAFVYGLTVRF